MQDIDDKKYEDVTGLLKNLSKVNAPPNFETELTRRINKGEGKKEKESWFDKIFSPNLVPSMALAVTAMIIIFLLNEDVEQAEDPFQIMPKLREEILLEAEEPAVFLEKSETVKKPKIVKREKSNGKIGDELQSEKPIQSSELDMVTTPAAEEESIERIAITETNDVPEQKIIMGGGLNFRMVSPDEKDRKLVEMLKEKVDTLAKSQQIKPKTD